MSAVDPPAPEQTSAGPPEIGGRPGLLSAVLQGVRRRWPIAAAVGLVLGAGSGFAYYSTHPHKSTVATVLVIDPVGTNLLGDQGDRGPSRDDEYRRTQVAMIRTKMVLQPTLRDSRVADTVFARTHPDPLTWLETELKAVITDGGILRLSLTGENPEEMAVLLNAIVTSYLSEVVDAEVRDRRRKLSEADKALVMLEGRLRTQRELLRNMADQLRTGDTQALTVKQKVAIESFNSLWLELHRLDSDLRRSKAEIEVLRVRAEAAKTGSPPEVLVAEALAADPAVRAAAARVDGLREVLEAAAKNAAPGATALNGVRAEVQAAEGRLAAVKEQRRDEAVKRVREGIFQQTAGALREAEAKVQVLERQRADLAPEVTRREHDADGIGMRSFELERQRAEMAEGEASVKRLRVEKERLMIEIQTYKPRVSQMGAADAADAKPSSYRLPGTFGLGVAGLCAGVFGVGLIESRRRRLIDPGDLPRALQLRTLGIVPEAPGLATGPVADFWGDRHGVLGTVVVESVNDIRALLLCGGMAGHPKVVLLTSAVQGEGKTTLASLLAVSVAQTSQRTLLIDGDTRNPRVHEKFGLAGGPGLSEVLRGETTLARAIQEIPGTNLSILPAGRVCQRVVRGLTSEGVRALLAPLRDRYDLILLDSCPILPVPDGLILSTSVDATILVVRSGTSTEPVVREACERLASVRARVVGGIVNRLRMGRSQISYPYAGAVGGRGADSPTELAGDSSRPPE
ncbi:MAG: capsular exopolysaccharide biosynthesis protein [Gemmataceae bacterium]|nr:capsular exopolysaccharide biosynthesis protein [Gemmataceae bacterium]